MKYVVLLYCSLTAFSIKSQSLRIVLNSFNLIEEVDGFIETAKEKSVAGGAYNVYVLKSLEDNNIAEDSYSIVLGYIYNSDMLHKVGATHYFAYQGELVLIVGNIARIKDQLKKHNIRIYELNNIEFIRSRLCPNEEGKFISGISEARIFRVSKKQITKMWIDNDDQLQGVYSIFQKSNFKPIIEKIK